MKSNISAEPEEGGPASHEAMALRLLLQAAASLGGKLGGDIVDRIEAERQAEAVRLSKGTRRMIKRHDREKPTRERLAKGEFATVDGGTFDSARKGERVWVNLRAKAGGAGEMYARGSISDRQLMAAAKLCMFWELSQASQLSGIPMGERVDGGSVGDDGRRGALALLRSNALLNLQNGRLPLLDMRSAMRARIGRTENCSKSRLNFRLASPPIAGPSIAPCNTGRRKAQSAFSQSTPNKPPDRAGEKSFAPRWKRIHVVRVARFRTGQA